MSAISTALYKNADDVCKCPWSVDFLYEVDKNRQMEHQKRVLQYIVKFSQDEKVVSQEDQGIKGDFAKDSYECDAFYTDLNMIPGCNSEPAWIILPSKSVLKPDIMLKLGTGPVGAINVATLNRADKDETKSHYVVKTLFSFISCKILRVIPSFYNTFVIGFSYTGLKIEDSKLDLYGTKGESSKKGQSVCVINLQSGELTNK